jgi:hypothetical protein
MLNGYDIIGDIHGCADKLKALLTRLGYSKTDGVWKHPERMAIFLGDYIDRGPQILETLNIVRAMQEAGEAICLMGNHEFNAIGWNTPDPDAPGEYLRRHTEAHALQHAETLDQLAGLYEYWVDWMRKLPLWLELGDLGGKGGRLHMVHACWSPDAMAVLLQSERNGETAVRGRHDAPIMSARGYIPAGRDRDSIEFHAVDTLLKGPEVALPDEATFTDKDGAIRDSMRVKWWLNPAATCREMALMGQDDAESIPEGLSFPRDEWAAIPVEWPTFFGHYWRSPDEPVTVYGPKLACLDFSAVKGGPLVAYQWNRGDSELHDENFVILTEEEAERPAPKAFFP